MTRPLPMTHMQAWSQQARALRQIGLLLAVGGTYLRLVSPILAPPCHLSGIMNQESWLAEASVSLLTEILLISDRLNSLHAQSARRICLREDAEMR